ncbi:MAG: shikimate dehydrogenase [Gammaproteobacteria bacterium]|nr:MAG: shikimate dehydrogenase [Gammaproteobacteria bacterium]
MTDRYGVIGHPIAHSKSPVIHQQFANQTRQDLSYEAIDIAPEVLTESLDSLICDGFKGLNVTVPHKHATLDLMDELSDRARCAGAVNTISVSTEGRLVGDNTDGIGLIRDLKRNLGISIRDKNILILGAGGATRGIVPTLLDAGPQRILIANRTAARAAELAAEFSKVASQPDAIVACQFDALADQSFDLIINATSAGLNGEVPPFPTAIIRPEVVCYDLSYAMTPTPFIRWADEHGAERTHQGWGMLVEQAAESFWVWRGMRPETAPILAQLP